MIGKTRKTARTPVKGAASSQLLRFARRMGGVTFG
jgi:hypothetical protein